MATHFYSPTTKGFYVQGLHKKMPDDVVSLSEDQYSLLMEGQALGKQIIYKSRKVQLADRVDEELTWADIRTTRDDKLKSCDWTQLPDVKMTEELTKKWLDYRQALRDLTEVYASPDVVVWPTPPNKTEEE